MALAFKDGLWKQVGPDEPNVVQIDACPTCNGAWFDAGELDVLAGGESGVEGALSEPTKQSERTCPRGCGPLDERKLESKEQKVRTPLDWCPVCHGLWLDGEERRKLAKSTTREGQQKATRRWARRGAIWAAQLLTQLPVEVDNPARGTPYVVYALLGIFLSMFGLELAGVVDLGHCQPGPNARPVGDLCLAPVAGMLRHQVKDMGLVALVTGNWYTLVTHIFLHGGWAHLLGNCYFLYVFGDNVEHLFGHKRFTVFFVTAGVLGGLAEVLLTKNTLVPVVGASGGIAGVMAAYMWSFPRNKLFQVILFIQVKLPAWVYLFVWVGFQLVMGVIESGEARIAWWSHVGGFAVGAAVTPLVLKQRRREIAKKVGVPASRFAAGSRS